MDLPNWLSLERVGRPDFRAATGQLVLGDFLRHNRTLFLPTGRANGGETNYDPRIISGFDWTTALVGAGVTRTMNRGAGLFPYRDPEDNTVKYMVLFAEEGEATINVDFSSAADPSTQDVYVRLVVTPADFANRVFWNPSGAPAAEYVSNVATRQTVVWEVTFQTTGLASPGDEWVKVWEVSINAGAISAGEDFRHFYFEGSANSTDDYGFEWGDGANDRDSDRATYGANDLHLILQGIRRQLADIIGDPVGDHGWFSAPAIELEQLASEHWPESAGVALRGKHKFINLGSTGQFWQLLTAATADQHSLFWQASFTTDGCYAELMLGRDGSGYKTGRLEFFPNGVSAWPANPGDYFDLECGFWQEHLELEVAGKFAKRWRYGASDHMALISGSSEQGLHLYFGPMYTAEGLLFEAAATVQQQVIPLSLANDLSATWYLFTSTAGTDYLSISGQSEGECTIHVTLPHNAVLNSILVMWSQDAASGGAHELRMYAHKQRAAQKTVGQVGGGTGTPTSPVSLHATQDWIEQALGGSAPYRAVQEFDCTASVGNRTFDSTQDRLALMFQSADDVGVTCHVYWIWIEYDILNVTPPLV